MDLLHLTHKKNLKSILQHGILPSYIDLPNHWETFKNYGLNSRKCVYTWNGETYNNSKFIKDMIYTKMFIHPRNKLYSDYDPIPIDFKKFGEQLFGNGGTHYLLKITDVEDDFIENSWRHLQEPDDRHKDSSTTIMSDKYAHDDKIVHVSSSVIKPIKFKIVEQIDVRVYNQKELGFTFRKF